MHHRFGVLEIVDSLRLDLLRQQDLRTSRQTHLMTLPDRVETSMRKCEISLSRADARLRS